MPNYFVFVWQWSDRFQLYVVSSCLLSEVSGFPVSMWFLPNSVGTAVLKNTWEGSTTDVCPLCGFRVDRELLGTRYDRRTPRPPETVTSKGGHGRGGVLRARLRARAGRCDSSRGQHGVGMLSRVARPWTNDRDGDH